MRLGRYRAACAVAALLLATAASCTRSPAGEEDAAGGSPVVPVHVRAVEPRSFHEAVLATGQWKAPNPLVVTAPFVAYVESLRVEVGDGVMASGRVRVGVADRARPHDDGRSNAGR